MLVIVIVVAFAASAGASAFTGIILERVAYRPLRGRNAPRLAFLISAIGMSLFLQELVAVNLFGHTIIGRLPSGTFVLEKDTIFKFFDADIRIDQVIVVTSAVLMMVALDQFVRRTRLGRGVRAVSQDIETAQLMGVNIDRVIMLTFLLGGIMAGGAGLLYLLTLERTALQRRLLPRHQGVHGRRPRRHRQPAGRAARRPAARAHRELRFGHLRQPVARPDRVHRPHPRSAGAADRHPR